MTEQPGKTSEITSDILLRAYSVGIFPMAESADDPSIHWIEPRLRGIIPLDGFHLSNKLRRLVKSDRFELRINRNFAAVIDGCAEAVPDRPSTWINSRIKALYLALHERGACHSVEVYEGGILVGGLYGVQLGAAFFGESMFHRVRDASKVALVHLVCRLRAGGFMLLDTQFITAHLQQFGAIEIPAAQYRRKLQAALARPAEFDVWQDVEPISGGEALRALANTTQRL
jgi:leucyl/phenylalanyl-tRNA--protein transferase